MIEFRVLGTIEVDGVEPPDAAALRSHPRWIAALAYLLCSASGAGRRRDELVSMLWPSVEQARGRASLRVVLHGLRRHLGRDTILSHGDELRVDRDLLTCDALVFEELLSKRRHEQALAAYAGDLLPGLAVRRAPRFDRWLADRSAALRRGAVSAAWAVSAMAARRGQWIDAVRYARRAVSLSGDSEAAVRRLLRTLDRAGDGASAIDEYERFADRWQRERGVAPSAETRALVAEIRSRRPGRTPAQRVGETVKQPRAEPGSEVAGSRAPEPTEVERWPHSVRIVVLPFQIEGEDPAFERLAAGMAHDVSASLARIARIVVVARPATACSPSAGRRGSAAEIGRQLEADLVLDTGVRVVSDRFVFIGRLIDVQLGRPIWAEAYDGTPNELLSVRRRLLHDLLTAAGLELSSAERERLTYGQTSSPTAFELYLEARSRSSRRTEEEVRAAIGLYEEALAIDPRFALAHAGLMDAHLLFHPAAGRRLSESRSVARRAGQKALEIAPELGEVHATLGFLRGFMDHEWEGSVADLRRAIELSPGYAEAHQLLGAVLTFALRSFDEGARELEIARQLDPCSPVIREAIGLALMNRGDLDGARRIFTEIMEDEPGFWRAHYYLGVTCFIAGETESGTAHLQRAWRLGAFGAEAESSVVDEPAEASWRVTLERRLTRLTTSALQPGIRAVECALLSMFLGRSAEAVRWLGTVLEHSSAGWVMMCFPVFEPLLGEPGFRRFLEEAGVVDQL